MSETTAGLEETTIAPPGELRSVIAPVTTIWRDRDRSARDRELVFGEAFRVEGEADGMAFGRAERDGYPGFVEARDLAQGTLGLSPTHRVAAPRSYAFIDDPVVFLPRNPLKLPNEPFALSFGARVTVRREVSPGWVELADVWQQPGLDDGRSAFAPAAHLAPLDLPESDPIAVAERLLGTPYLWGGNSAFGIDCSGLVQIACLACGIPCPGDSDQQEKALGAPLPGGAEVRRGDLVFWPGHVAWVADRDRIVHANAHTMSVAYEGLPQAIARIEAQGDGPVTARKRLDLPVPGPAGGRNRR